MTPLDFLTDYNGHNDPVGDHMEMLKKELIITDGVNDYQILSYYVDKKGNPVLDIEVKS